MSQIGKKKSGGLKEFCRKRIVGLKRNPSIIPLLMLAATFLFYSLNLTLVSNSTAKIQGQGMGLCQFATTLFSLLSLVCMLNAFPRRQKPNVLMLTVLFVMLAIMIFCDAHYIGRITAAITRAESPIDVTTAPYIPAAKAMLQGHIVCLVVSGLLVALLPVYSKFIKKINTSVLVEENVGMGTIELSE